MGIKVNKKMIAFLCDIFCVENSKSYSIEDLERILSHKVYKYTACGACLTLKEDYIIIGSIVEGVDFGCEDIELFWPFTEEQFDNAIAEIEDEAKYIWDNTHGCDDCPEGEWGYHAIDPNCKTCKGEGVIR